MNWEGNKDGFEMRKSYDNLQGQFVQIFVIEYKKYDSKGSWSFSTYNTFKGYWKWSNQSKQLMKDLDFFAWQIIQSLNHQIIIYRRLLSFLTEGSVV